jgi:hypothetical protein
MQLLGMRSRKKRWLGAILAGALSLGLLVQSFAASPREERPWLTRTLADRDPSGVRDGLLRMAAIYLRSLHSSNRSARARQLLPLRRSGCR